MLQESRVDRSKLKVQSAVLLIISVYAFIQEQQQQKKNLYRLITAHLLGLSHLGQRENVTVFRKQMNPNAH